MVLFIVLEHIFNEISYYEVQVNFGFGSPKAYSRIFRLCEKGACCDLKSDKHKETEERFSLL